MRGVLAESPRFRSLALGAAAALMLSACSGKTASSQLPNTTPTPNTTPSPSRPAGEHPLTHCILNASRISYDKEGLDQLGVAEACNPPIKNAELKLGRSTAEVEDGAGDIRICVIGATLALAPEGTMPKTDDATMIGFIASKDCPLPQVGGPLATIQPSTLSMTPATS